MADIVDSANEVVEQANNRFLHQHRNRPKLSPIYNDTGDKICLDCEQEIPKLRAAIQGTVRCIECQTISEKYFD